MMRNGVFRKIIIGLLCLATTSCANLLGVVQPTNAPLPIITLTLALTTATEKPTNTPLLTATNPGPTVVPAVSSVTQDVFIQTSIKQNYHQFGNLYIMNDCAHSGIFGVRLTNSTNMPSWWGIVFSEPYDISKYQSLNFWIKGDFGGESFDVLIEDKANTEIEIKSSSLDVNVSSVDWHLVEVPLNSSAMGTNSVTEIKSFVIGVIPTDEVERICIDDIYFSSQAK